MVTHQLSFTAASARVLRKITTTAHVTFGIPISGRSNLPVGLRDVVGHCLNKIPARIMSSANTPGQILEAVQSQRIASLPHETYSFEDIRRNCTDWTFSPENDENGGGCIVHYQDWEQEPVSSSDAGMQFQVFDREDENMEGSEVVVSAKPSQDRSEVEIRANRRWYDEEEIERLLESLLVAISRLVEDE